MDFHECYVGNASKKKQQHAKTQGRHSDKNHVGHFSSSEFVRKRFVQSDLDDNTCTICCIHYMECVAIE